MQRAITIPDAFCLENDVAKRFKILGSKYSSIHLKLHILAYLRHQ